MTQKKTQEPKQDWGFYAVTPRIIRTKYKDLSHAEKWLYTCLKDLCGDKGACFRSLRSLSEETDISIASLSKMIPNLHKAGLIHAEKKRRTKSGKEIWHITIIDIWQENAKHCKDCSKIEQSSEGTTEVVQNMNKNASGCSENEQSSELDCSNFRYRRITKDKDTEEGTYAANETANHRTDSFAHSFSLSDLSEQDLLAELERRRNQPNENTLSNRESIHPSESVDNPTQVVDKQASSEVEHPSHHIANPTTSENPNPVGASNPVESLTIGDTSQSTYSYEIPKQVTLTAEEKRIQGYWCQLGFVERPSARAHWATLSKHLHSFEDMKSLYTYTKWRIRDDPAIKVKTVNPGNLANAGILDGWKQDREPEPELPKSAKPKKQKITPEYLASLPV